MVSKEEFSRIMLNRLAIRKLRKQKKIQLDYDLFRKRTHWMRLKARGLND